MNKKDKDAHDIYNTCLKLIDDGNIKEALILSDSISVEPLRAAILIDGGTVSSQSGKIKEGTEIFENLLSSDPTGAKYSRYSLLYNAANGHSSIYALKQKRRKKTTPPNNENLRTAKSYYREALTEVDKIDRQFASQLWVNYGNCLSSFGRYIEALTCYQNALEAEPSHGMAAGNLGQELVHVASILGTYRHEYIALAHEILSQAFSESMNFDSGSYGAVQSFEETLKNLQKFIDLHETPISSPEPIKINQISGMEEEYIAFCLNKGLFLNAWVGDKKLSPGITDDISFGPIITKTSDNNLVPELLNILNEVKEAFSTARFLYFLSQQENNSYNEISQFTTYFHSTSAYEINGLFTGLCKTAYSRAFDILDKVARITNVYFEIGNRKSSFWNVFVAKQSLGQENIQRFEVRPEISKIHNYSLYALADLCIDHFETNHLDLQKIDHRRNKITHDFLNVKLNMTKTEMLDDNLILLDDLYHQTEEVLQLVKYAILYTVSAVNIQEGNKNSSGNAVDIEYWSSTGQPRL